MIRDSTHPAVRRLQARPMNGDTTPSNPTALVAIAAAIATWLGAP